MDKYYQEYPAISYSKLSKLSKNPKSVIDNRETFNDGIAFGDCLDLLLTQGEDKFNEKYIVVTKREERPVGQLGEFIDILYSLHWKHEKKIDIVENIPIFDEYLVNEAYKRVGFKRDSQPKVVDKVYNEGLNYLKFLIESENKKRIDYEEYLKAVRARDILRNHTFTSRYFDQPKEGIDIYYQYPIYFDVKYGIEGKALLDIVIVDHKNKVIKPIDIKTTGNYINQFPIDFLKWQYYLQASFYTYGLGQLYKGYTIELFKFIVLSSVQIDTPIIYECTEEDLYVGEYGGYNKLTNREIKGWRKLVEDYLWHKEKNLWEYPREVYETNGIVKLDLLKHE